LETAQLVWVEWWANMEAERDPADVALFQKGIYDPYGCRISCSQTSMPGKAFSSPVSLQDPWCSLRVTGLAQSNGWKILPADAAGYPDLTL